MGAATRALEGGEDARLHLSASQSDLEGNRSLAKAHLAVPQRFRRPSRVPGVRVSAADRPGIP